MLWHKTGPRYSDNKGLRRLVSQIIICPLIDRTLSGGSTTKHVYSQGIPESTAVIKSYTAIILLAKTWYFRLK